MLLAATSIIGSLAKSSSESQSRAVVHDKIILDRIRAKIYVHVIEHTTHCVCSYS